jgi:iron complex outermembrane recepter protein
MADLWAKQEGRHVSWNRTHSKAWIRASLLGGACAAALLPIPASAQDTGEVVVVTGIRGSLQRNLDIKRESVGVVDAISAEDIGKFPDTNLAESIMRIPGVTVTRGVSSGSSTGATSTTGEATAITVRGFGPSFNQTLFDGRQVPSALGNTQGNSTGDRAFDFSSLTSDFVSQIDVMKTPDASLSSGAIGATINIHFPKPFDHPGLVVAGSFSGSVSPERGTWSPNGDILISDTFAHDTLGVLAAVAYTDTRVRQNHINIQGWNGVTTGTGTNQINPSQYAGTPPPDGSPNYFIQDYGIFHELTNRERIQGRLVLQWRPSDALEVTVSNNFARDHTVQNQYGYSVWFNAGSLQNVQTNENGTVVSFIQPATPTDFQGQINGQVLQLNDAGINVKWALSEHLSFMVDLDHAEAWLNPGGQLGAIDSDVGYGGINAVDLSIVVPEGHGIPYPATYGPAGNKAQFINNGVIGSHVFPMTSNQNLDTINQVKVEGHWTESNLDVKFGFQYIAEHKNEDVYDTFGNNNWQAYSGYGPASGSTAGVALPQNFFTGSFSTADFINGWSGSENLPPAILAFNPYTVLNYLQGLGNPQTTTIPGANVNCCDLAAGADPNAPENIGRPFDGTFKLAWGPNGHHILMEKTFVGYIAATLKTEAIHMPLTVNIGARYEITNEDVVGIGRLPTAFTVQTGDPTAYDVAYGTSGNVTASHSYQYLLPNIDLILSLTDDLDIRFNASRTLTRPPIGNLNPVFSIGAARLNNVTANGGNPDLLPYLSDNVDLGAQWYYQTNSYLSASTFLKSVSNFVVQGTTQQVFAGVGPGGVDIPYTLSATVNGPAANVYGLEVTWQHVFDDSGFGFLANGTLVGTDKPYDPFDRAVGSFAVTGLADSANLMVFYDKGGFQARLAANWQDSYLDHFGQLQNGSQFGTEPTFVNGSWNLNFSTSYDVTQNLTLYFEAMNITDATYSTHGRFSEQVLDVVDYGRRFIVGAHFKM